MGAAAEAFDAPTPYGSLSYHRIGRNPPVIFGPAGAFYPVAGLLAFPATANLIRGIAAYASGVLFDRRGLGWSDPLPEDRPPSLDNQVEDMVRVLDHAKVEQAYVWAVGFDAQPALAFAARHPSRTAGVLALGTTAKLVRSPDHPHGMDPAAVDRWLATVDPDRRQRPLDLFGLVLPDSQEPGADREWFDRVGRHGASPSTARRYLEAAIGFDVREEVTKITAPTIVIHNRGDQLIDVAEARELAALIPGARLVERDRPEHVMFSGDASDLVSEIERFVTGSTGRRRRASAPEGWDSLTPAELRVTKLVAQGKSNAEIAATLFITTETVKSHVAAALRKTASASRTILSSRYHSQFRDT